MYNIAETYNGYNDNILRSLKNDLYDNEKKGKQLEELFKEIKKAFLPEGMEIGDINGDELYELYQEFKKTGGKNKEDFALFIKERKLLKNSKIKKPKIKNKIKLFFRRRKLFRKIANSLRVIKIKYFQKTRSFDDELFIMKMRFGVKTANKVKEELEKLGVTDLKEQVDFNILKISTNKVFCKDEELLNFINKEKERKGFLETVKECVNNIVDNIIGAKSETKEFNTFIESIGEKFQVGNKIKVSHEKDIVAVSKLVEKGKGTRKNNDLEDNFISMKEPAQEHGIIGQLKKSIALSKSIDLEAKANKRTTKKENEVENSVVEDTKTIFKPMEKSIVKEEKNTFKSPEKTVIQEVKNDFKRDIGIEKTIEKILNKKKEMETSKTMEQQKETTKEQLMNKLDNNKQETKLNETPVKTEPTKTNEAKPIVGEYTKRLAERRNNFAARRGAMSIN